MNFLVFVVSEKFMVQHNSPLPSPKNRLKDIKSWRKTGGFTVTGDCRIEKKGINDKTQDKPDADDSPDSVRKLTSREFRAGSPAGSCPMWPPFAKSKLILPKDMAEKSEKTTGHAVGK